MFPLYPVELPTIPTPTCLVTTITNTCTQTPPRQEMTEPVKIQPTTVPNPQPATPQIKEEVVAYVSQE